MMLWVRLPRCTSADALSQAPLFVRALEAELHRLADDDGRIFVGRKEPWEAIAVRGGATVGDRRLLRSLLPELFTAGLLICDGEHIQLTRTAERVERERGASRTRTRSESGANEERVGRESGAKNVVSDRNNSCDNARVEKKGEDPDQEEEQRSADFAATEPPGSGVSARPTDGSPTPGVTAPSPANATDGSPEQPDQAAPSDRPTRASRRRTKPAATQEADPQVLEVFEHYLAGWRRTIDGKRPPTLDQRRYDLIAKRLKEKFTVEHLKVACDGVWLSNFHVEQKHYGAELIFRDAAHVERFAAIAEANSARRVGLSAADVLATWQDFYRKSKLNNYNTTYVPEPQDDERAGEIAGHAARLAEERAKGLPNDEKSPLDWARLIIRNWCIAYLRDSHYSQRRHPFRLLRDVIHYAPMPWDTQAMEAFNRGDSPGPQRPNVARTQPLVQRGGHTVEEITTINGAKDDALIRKLGLATSAE